MMNKAPAVGFSPLLKKRPKKSTNERNQKSIGLGFSPAKQKLRMKDILNEGKF
jgi:hypothetical protein